MFIFLVHLFSIILHGTLLCTQGVNQLVVNMEREFKFFVNYFLLKDVFINILKKFTNLVSFFI